MANKSQKKYKYTAVFEPDKNDGGYTVTIPALPGCISEGDNFEDALANIKEAAELYLEVKPDATAETPDEINTILIAPIEIKV